MTKYIKVDWPELQKFQELSNYNDDCYEMESGTVAFVPEELYEEVMRKLEFPKKYEDTNIGTVVLYANYAVVNGNKHYYYNLDHLRRNDEVLTYSSDSKEWNITICKACSRGFPVLLEDKSLIPGINCVIVGFYSKQQ